jgi:regulator of protease activity HflC (stomatin/prohibitin superfamily)
MGWLIVTILVALALGGCAIAWVSAPTPGNGRLWSAGIGLGLGAVYLVVTLLFSFATLGTGHVGLQYNFAGKLVGVKDKPGLIVKAPWSSLLKESVQIQREEFQLDTANSAVSKDQQPITADLVINYEVDPKHVLDLYKNVGPSWRSKLIDSRVLQDFKEVTATYPTIKITNAREQLRVDTRDRLRRELAPYSITVTDFFIQNLGFSKAYENAVEQKQVQVQKAQQAQAKVAQATAEAEQAVAIAEGQAKAINAKGRAIRANPQILYLEAIDKLNPRAQVIICTGTTCPSILPTGLSGLTAGGASK